MKYVGYVPKEKLPIKQNDKILIPKGTFIRSMYPRRNEYYSKKSIRVNVHHILSGSSNGSNPKVVWAGSSGYWAEVDINDVLEANNL